MTGGYEVIRTEVVVLGAGPGGYAAAFRASDLGAKTVLIDRREALGGACLHVGCIPSKALLHVAQVINQADGGKAFGVEFGKPQIDLERVRGWKDDLVAQLTGGLDRMSKMRGVDFIQGDAHFESSRTLRLEGPQNTLIEFEHAVIATGSSPTELPLFKIDSPRILDSSSALELTEVYNRILVVGGGYIGLELGTIYASLGSKITVVELAESLLPEVDRDLVRPLQKKLEDSFGKIHLNTEVHSVDEVGNCFEVCFTGQSHQSSEPFDAILLAVGRTPNLKGLGLDQTEITFDDGFIATDHQCRTEDNRIFAIGDVAGQPMLAHKASREGKVAAEVIAGQMTAFDNVAIPAVIFTDPEIAWCGLTEREARSESRDIKVTRFPWAASGRALSLNRTDGLTKLILDPKTRQVLGVGIVGPGAGELIAEGCLAVEMAAMVDDIAATIHPHPTLSETLMESAEVLFGHSCHVYKK
jgi:dihydrolipoamide dehydrogenase